MFQCRPGGQKWFNDIFGLKCCVVLGTNAKGSGMIFLGCNGITVGHGRGIIYNFGFIRVRYKGKKGVGVKGAII